MAQRAEVIRLREQGHSIRAIAEAVFNDRRYRGRVERILAAKQEPQRLRPASEAPPRPDLTNLEPTEMLRALFAWRLALWALSPEPPSITQLETMLRVQRTLAAIEEHERLRATTRRTNTP